MIFDAHDSLQIEPILSQITHHQNNIFPKVKFIKHLQKKHSPIQIPLVQKQAPYNSDTIDPLTTQKIQEAKREHEKGSLIETDSWGQQIRKPVRKIDKQGNIVEGNWVNGLLHGDVKIKYQSGMQFEGKYELGEKKEGKIKLNQNTMYEGEFYKKLFHGKGTLTTKNRTFYGNWKDGELVGEAKIVYKSGIQYIGGVKNFKKHGKGCLKFGDAWEYTGGFEDGEIKGYGVYSDQETEKKGIWINGQLHLSKSNQQQNFVI